MRAERHLPVEADRRSIGPATLILAAGGCFAIGFLTLMAVPRLWPRYVQTAASDAPVQHPVEVGVADPPAPPKPGTPVPGVITQIRPGAALATQKISRYGTLANLAECKAAIRSGETYENVGPDQMAAIFGTRGKPLTSAQLDAGCRKLTE